MTLVHYVSGRGTPSVRRCVELESASVRRLKQLIVEVVVVEKLLFGARVERRSLRLEIVRDFVQLDFVDYVIACGLLLLRAALRAADHSQRHDRALLLELGCAVGG